MNNAMDVTPPPQICLECWRDVATTCGYEPSGGRVWAAYCRHNSAGATLDLGDGSAEPRWLVVPNVSLEEWAMLLALSAHKAMRLAEEGADAVRKAAEPGPARH